MKASVIPASLMNRFNRMDAAFLQLAAEHLPLVDELLAKYTLPELNTLAETLPFDPVAAAALSRGRALVRATQSSFITFLHHQRKPDTVAVYCACAAQYAISKRLTEVEALKQRELEIVTELKTFMEDVLARQAMLLHAAIVGKKEEGSA